MSTTKRISGSGSQRISKHNLQLSGESEMNMRYSSVGTRLKAEIGNHDEDQIGEHDATCK